jgi:hypothetical protein
LLSATSLNDLPPASVLQWKEEIAMRFALVACALTVAFGQTDRAFQFTQNQSGTELEQIAVTLRAIADLPQVSIDSADQTVTVAGTPDQIAMADWLARQLDLPVNIQNSGIQEYRPAGGSDDVVRVLQLAHTSTPQQLQEIATLIRSIGDIRRLFVYHSRRIVALRATSEQIALAAWLVSELDKPLDGRAATQDTAARHEYWLSSGPDNLVRVFFLPVSQSAQRLQQVAVQVRTATRIPRLFTYNALRAMAVRGTVGQLAAAERMIEEMKAQ